MEQKNNTDPELAKVIDDAIAHTTTYLAAYDKVLKWQKQHRGLKGVHISVNPFKTTDAENVAHDVLMMHKAVAEGHYRDATNELI